MLPETPALDGILTAHEVAATAASIAAMQEPDGAIPWTVGEHVDVWNHVEAAMALLVGGEVEAAHRAYDWCLATQREDGSWPMKLVARRGRGRQRRDEHDGVPRRRGLAPLAGPPRRGRSYAGCGRPSARALDFVVGHAAALRRDRLVAGGRRQGQRRGAAGRQLEHLPGAAGRGRAVGADGRRRSRTGSSPPAGSATRCASTATCSWTSPRSRWTGTTRCSAARCAARPGST